MSQARAPPARHKESLKRAVPPAPPHPARATWAKRDTQTRLLQYPAPAQGRWQGQLKTAAPPDVPPGERQSSPAKQSTLPRGTYFSCLSISAARAQLGQRRRLPPASYRCGDPHRPGLGAAGRTQGSSGREAPRRLLQRLLQRLPARRRLPGGGVAAGVVVVGVARVPAAVPRPVVRAGHRAALRAALGPSGPPVVAPLCPRRRRASCALLTVRPPAALGPALDHSA